jgi:4-hydroxy-3-methylbut-2-en-1-yl diphosphate reductase
LLIVVGDPLSNNSNRLTQVSVEIANTPSYRVSDVSEIEIDWLKDINTVAVTAGASTPTIVVREVIAFLEKFDPEDSTTHYPEKKFLLEKILPRIKNPTPVERIEPYV